MNESFKEDLTASIPQKNEPDMMALVKEIQQRLVFLERKIDTLLNQSMEKPFRQERPRPFGGFNRHRTGGRFHHGPKDGSFSQGGHPRSGKPHRGEPREFGHGKKPFSHRGKD